MENTKLSPMQLFALLVLFQLGTALVVNLGMAAREDAWIAVLCGMLVGCLLFLGYAFLYTAFPDKLPTQYMRLLLGKYLGGLIGFAYILFYMNKASRDLMDGGLLVFASTLKETPLFIINTVMMLTIIYVLHKGIEVLARTAFILLWVVFVIGIIILFLLLFSGIIDFTRILPVLSDGFGPVLESVYRQNYQFPFGEIICFTMVLPYLNNVKAGVRAGLMSVLLSGMILSGTVVITISILGVDIAERSIFPLLTMVGKASIADFIQRLDILVVMVLIIGDFFKIAVYFYAAVIGASDLFKIPYRKVLYPLALIVLFTSITIARTYSEHVKKGGDVLYIMDPLFYVIVPAALIVAALIYRFRFRRHSGT
ncbi:spore germination protein (amino acid permease) [Paenibacillus sp. oral taxon 786 str. D14]|uniref:GerAB/ArcD/ProY family transporter n=1 Tax=Paenibacillus sp. oral taxon 786 TaxID=652715 RepID=UPI0001AFCE85|nr:GerAB/ArcD/ProY family transporter [Paenibacillus sp. oral taxon 786]EES74684.1 spore germination protein (amino acid permease) [Paenibacillus sp. oral taxon 786 str. D14]